MNSFAENEKLFIVVLDDNPTDLTIAGFLIAREGYEAKTFDNHTKCLEFLSQNHTSVKMILMDNEMPGLSGIDIVKRLKKNPVLKNIPVVMMTGDSSPATVQKAIQCGAIDYLVKPIDPLVFETKLKKHLAPADPDGSMKSQWIEYKLGQITKSAMDLKVPGVLISIGEMSMTLQTEYEVSSGSVFVVDTAFFQEIGIKAVPLRVDSCTELEEGKYFMLKCTLMGVPEGDLRKIRLFCQTLFRNNTRLAG